MDTKEKAKAVLRKLGANGNYLGTSFAASACELLEENSGRLSYLMKELYLPLAKEYATNISCVERNIRTVIKVIWEKGNREFLEEMAGRKLEKRPANKEFLDFLFHYIQEAEI